ncbi:MAG: AMP-dependent synthetase/ligase, partial [Pseudomonadota bacterium]
MKPGDAVAMERAATRGASEGDTLIRRLAENGERHGGEVAMREKDRGIWKETTWAGLTEEVLRCAAGLDALGVGEGDAVIVLGDNRVRLYAGMLAVGALGAFAMPAYPGATLDELEHYVHEARVLCAIAEDQEHVDKVLDLRAAGTEVPHIVYDDPRGLNAYQAHGLTSWETLLARGAERLREEPGLRDALIGRATPDGPAVFLHSSGTTGKPKGIVLSHRNMLAAVRNGREGGVFREGEEVVAYLPMAWVGDFALTLAAGVALRFVVNVPERQETVMRDTREIAPTLYLAAPRSWDNLLTTVQVQIEDSTRLKKWIYHRFMDRAIAAERRKLEGEPGTAGEWLWRWLGERLVFGPIKDQFGFLRLSGAFTGGEAIGEDTFIFFRALGIRLRQLYGQTENSALNAIQDPEEVKLHTVGRPLPGVEARIGEGGEILLRGESVFAGYHANPEATAETLQGGWLHTGDAGYMDEDGHLVVLGRLSEVVHTAGGERYVPNYIENRLKFSPYIKDAAVVGAGREQLCAMLCVDFAAVGHWAEVNGVPYVSYADLSQREEVNALLRDAVRRVNETLPEALRLHRYVSL